MNGNAAASAAVSIVRVSLRASVPAGRVVTQPCRDRKVAGAVTSSSELATARTAATSSARSSSAGGVDGQVQAEAEQLPLAAGQPVRQVPGVPRGGLGVRVIELAAVRAGAAPRFQPGPLPAQPVRCRGRGDRVDVQGDVEAAGVGQQRLQPPGGDLSGVAGDREGRGVVVADPQVPGGDLDARRPGHRVRGGAVPGAQGAAAQGAGEVHGRVPGLVTGWPGTASRAAWMPAPGSAAAVSRAVTCPPSSALTVRSAADSSRAASAVRCAARSPPPPPRAAPGRRGGARG